MARGEALFDAALAAPPPPPEQSAANDATIPDAEALLVVGREVLERTGDPHARALAARAVALVAA